MVEMLKILVSLKIFFYSLNPKSINNTSHRSAVPEWIGDSLKNFSSRTNQDPYISKMFFLIIHYLQDKNLPLPKVEFASA